MKYVGFIICILMTCSLASAQTLKGGKKRMKRLVMPQEVASEVNPDSFGETISDKILPKTLSSTDSSQSVVAKIMDNSLMYWWDNSSLKNSSVGRAATKIEQNMKAEVNLGSSEGTEKVDHRLSFKVLASQALAKLEYKGWFKAALNYDARSAKTEAEVLENLDNNKDLVITHSMTRSENKSQLSLRWNW